MRGGGHGGGEAVDPEHAGVGRPGAALAGLERHLHPQATALQLGDQVRQPVVWARPAVSAGPVVSAVVSAGPVGPVGPGSRASRLPAETYAIRYVRSPSLINQQATSRQPHRCMRNTRHARSSAPRAGTRSQPRVRRPKRHPGASGSYFHHDRRGHGVTNRGVKGPSPPRDGGRGPLLPHRGDTRGGAGAGRGRGGGGAGAGRGRGRGGAGGGRRARRGGIGFGAGRRAHLLGSR